MKDELDGEKNGIYKETQVELLEMKIGYKREDGIKRRSHTTEDKISEFNSQNTSLNASRSCPKCSTETKNAEEIKTASVNCRAISAGSTYT